MNPKLASSLITWEAVYGDGRVVSEATGVSYDDLDRNGLVLFRLGGPGETLVEMAPPPGATGHNLVYRRRIGMTQSGASSIHFIVGWVPHGPILVIDPVNMQYREADGFVPGDPDLYPPVPVKGELGFVPS